MRTWMDDQKRVTWGIFPIKRYNTQGSRKYLLKGPDLMNGLTEALCKFSKDPVAIIYDVEKMFYQFHVS